MINVHFSLDSWKVDSTAQAIYLTVKIPELHYFQLHYRKDYKIDRMDFESKISWHQIDNDGHLKIHLASLYNDNDYSSLIKELDSIIYNHDILSVLDQAMKKNADNALKELKARINVNA